MQKIRNGGVLWLVISVLCGISGGVVPGFSSVAYADTQCGSGIQLVQNGSFETPMVTNAKLWDIFPAGNATLMGWQANWVSTQTTYYNPVTMVTDMRPDPQLEFQRTNHDSWGIAYDGQQYAELDTDWMGPAPDYTMSYPSSIDLYQTIVTTPGQQYTFSFAFSPRPDDLADLSDNSVIVGWNGATIDTVTATSGDSTHTTWTIHTYTVTATASTTRIDFTDNGHPNAIGTFIDAISVCGAGTNAGGNTDNTSGGGPSSGGSGDSTPTTTPTTPATPTSGGSSSGSGSTGGSAPTDVVSGGGGTISTPADTTVSGGGGASSPSTGGSSTGGGSGVTSGGGGTLPGEVLGAATEDTPGFPNTGAGGDSDALMALIALSAAVLAGTLAALLQRFVTKN